MGWLRMGRNGGRSPSENREGVVHRCYKWVYPCPCGVDKPVYNPVGILRGIA